MAQNNRVWLGGKQEFEVWSWSDNSTWGYTNWYRDPGNGGNNFYIKMGQSSGKWYGSTMSRPFICQIASPSLRGKKKRDLIYTKDQLTFRSFHVWYEYKAASQQVLDSWEDKRMTGIRFSWRIKNAPLIASISEVGKSIRTPHLGDAFEFPDDLVYRALLSPTKNIIEQIANL